MKKRRKEDETPGSKPENPEIGVELNQLPNPGSNLTPDPSTPFQAPKGVIKRRWVEDDESQPRVRSPNKRGESSAIKRLSASEIREKEKKNTYFKVKHKFENSEDNSQFSTQGI